jgi:hypothetical protein
VARDHRGVRRLRASDSEAVLKHAENDRGAAPAGRLGNAER